MWWWRWNGAVTVSTWVQRRRIKCIAKSMKLYRKKRARGRWNGNVARGSWTVYCHSWRHCLLVLLFICFLLYKYFFAKLFVLLSHSCLSTLLLFLLLNGSKVVFVVVVTKRAIFVHEKYADINVGIKRTRKKNRERNKLLF